jgi:hypothetical protein
MLWTIFSPALLNEFYIADDLGSFTIPLRHLYAEGLHAGRVDLWCSALFGGFYMRGEGQMGMLHPLHVFLYRHSIDKGGGERALSCRGDPLLAMGPLSDSLE